MVLFQEILIVDDEPSIRKTLRGALTDEGFLVSEAGSGEEALQQVTTRKPAVVLLDVWLPGMDGLEVLDRMRALDPTLPIIVMSGHATIATAVTATRRGAADFIEKPFDLALTLGAIRRALAGGNDQSGKNGGGSSGSPAELSSNRSGVFAVDPIVFTTQKLRGRPVPQRTVKHSGVLYGQGLHSGKKSGLIIEPLPPNSGIHFASMTSGAVVPAHVDFVQSTGFATTVRLGEVFAGTIEHVMSALHAYGVANALITCNGEVPVMDGSAREFCALLDEVGLETQPGDWYEIEVREPLVIERGGERISLEPADVFTIDYTLRYPAPVGEQRLVYTLNSPDDYRKLIAPSRTFGFVRDVGNLQKQGLALGGRFDNFVLFGEEGPINDQLRFPDEPVRHKILDAIGDLYLLGRRIRGKVTAVMTGHSDNVAILTKLRDTMRHAVR